MAGVEARDFGSPDETRTPDKTTIELVRMSGSSAARMRLEPGWRWSDCIKPIVVSAGDPVPLFGNVWITPWTTDDDFAAFRNCPGYVTTSEP